MSGVILPIINVDNGIPYFRKGIVATGCIIVNGIVLILKRQLFIDIHKSKHYDLI